MEEYSSKKQILKIIKNLRGEYKIADFIRENIPNELLEDESFVKKLIEINEGVEAALSLMKTLDSTEKIKEEIAKKGLMAVIEDEKKIKIIPENYREELYKIAETYEMEEEYEKAKKIYSRILEFGARRIDQYYKRYNDKEGAKETIYYKSKFAYYKCKIQSGEQLTEEDMKELKKLAEEDVENVLGLSKQGQLTDFELFESLFEDITVDELEQVILAIDSNHGGQEVKPDPVPGPHIEGTYDANLSPINRIKHLKEDFEIESCKKGKGKFTGYIIFKIKDKDTVIVEKFYDVKGKKENKQVVPSYGAATYYVHKDARIDLEKSDRSHLVERKKQESKNEKEGVALKLIDSRSHRGEKYYVDQVEKFNEIEENGKKQRHILATDTVEQVEEQTEENFEVSSKNSIEEMLEFIKEFDNEFEEMQRVLLEYDNEIKQINQNMSEIKEKISEKANELLKDDIIEIIKRELAIIEELKGRKKELEELKQKIELQQKRNREERAKLAKEFQDRVKGD